MREAQEVLKDLSAMPLKTVVALWILVKMYPPENEVEDLPLVDLPAWHLSRYRRGMDMFKYIDKRIRTLTGRILIGYLGDYVADMSNKASKFGKRAAVAGVIRPKEAFDDDGV
jgi:hypothetical protein